MTDYVTLAGGCFWCTEAVFKDVIGVTSVAPPPTPRYFKADHPFLFLIRDQKTNSVLFVGRVSNPKA